MILMGIVLVVTKRMMQYSLVVLKILLKPSITGKDMSHHRIYLGWQYEDGDFRAISLVGCLE
jgi:hypothetical protein